MYGCKWDTILHETTSDAIYASLVSDTNINYLKFMDKRMINLFFINQVLTFLKSNTFSLSIQRF